jgi:polysaccharide biosynthesis/export protein
MKTLLTSFSTAIVLGTVVMAQQATVPPQRPVGTAGSGAPTGTPSSTTTRPATPANETTTRPRPPADVGVDYRLVPGDKLRVEVYKDPQLSQSVQLRPDGKITLPLVNDINAAGRTPTELRDAISESLKPYITNPTVKVIVVETVPPVVYVVGEVNTSGPQSLIGRMDVLQALSAAGGFKDFANTKNILIRRGKEVLTFNYNDAVKGKTAPLMLQPGDTIIVR